MKQNYEDYWKQMTSKPSAPNYLGFEDINTIITLTLRHNYATHTLLKIKKIYYLLLILFYLKTKLLSKYIL